MEGEEVEGEEERVRLQVLIPRALFERVDRERATDKRSRDREVEVLLCEAFEARRSGRAR